MIKPFDVPELIEKVKEANTVLIATHINPDGDAIGSALSVYHALTAMGKQVTLSCADPVPGKLRFLSGAEQFVQADVLQGQTFDLSFAVDAADAGRIALTTSRRYGRSSKRCAQATCCFGAERALPGRW